MAFVCNTAAFWLPSLWPELQCRLPGASPRHRESHLYPLPNFPPCLLCPYTCDRSKTVSLHQQQSYSEHLREEHGLPAPTAHHCVAFAGSYGEAHASCKHSSYLKTTTKQPNNSTHRLSSCKLKSLMNVRGGEGSSAFVEPGFWTRARHSWPRAARRGRACVGAGDASSGPTGQSSSRWSM